MTLDEYYNIKIGDIIYNTKNNNIVKFNSYFGDNKERKEDDSIWQPYLNKEFEGESINAKDCLDWSYINDDSPLEVKFEILSTRFFELEYFVQSRFH